MVLLVWFRTESTAGPMVAHPHNPAHTQVEALLDSGVSRERTQNKRAPTTNNTQHTTNKDNNFSQFPFSCSSHQVFHKVLAGKNQNLF